MGLGFQSPAISSSSVQNIFDDRSPAVRYVGTFSQGSNINFYDSTYSVTSTINDYVFFTFEGTHFTYFYSSAPDQNEVLVYVDGSYIDTINTNSSGYLFNRRWVSPRFSYGVHNVQFVNSGSASNYMIFDAVVAHRSLYDYFQTYSYKGFEFWVIFLSVGLFRRWVCRA